MASKTYIRHEFKTLLPVKNDVIYEAETDGNVYQYDIYIQFLDASEKPVTPTAGIVNVYGSPFDQMLFEADGSPVNAKDVNVGVSVYTPPTINGLSEKIQVKFTGITGAQYAKVCIYRKG